jgi:excisionase family DNA binding protein
MAKGENQPSLVMTIPEFCLAMKISRTFGYQLAREGKLPVPVIHIGRRLLVSRKAVDQLLESEYVNGGKSDTKQ